MQGVMDRGPLFGQHFKAGYMRNVNGLIWHPQEERKTLDGCHYLRDSAIGWLQVLQRNPGDSNLIFGWVLAQLQSIQLWPCFVHLSRRSSSAESPGARLAFSATPMAWMLCCWNGWVWLWKLQHIDQSQPQRENAPLLLDSHLCQSCIT